MWHVLCITLSHNVIIYQRSGLLYQWQCGLFSKGLHIVMPPPRRGGGIKRSSSSVVRPSVGLMSRTSALTRKPKGLGRRNFAQGYPRSHATPTPTSRSKGQKSRSAGAGAYCGGHLAAHIVYTVMHGKDVATQ